MLKQSAPPVPGVDCPRESSQYDAMSDLVDEAARSEDERRDKLADLDKAERELMGEVDPIDDIMREFGLSRTEATISFERRKVYGDPFDNHRGIAMAWAGLLQPHWESIRYLKPLEPHVVALLMAGLKLNRMRNVFHQDNYDDCRVYLGFAQGWQRRWSQTIVGPGIA